MPKRILFAVEMVGTVNALKKPFALLEGESVTFSYAAAGAAATALKNSGTPYYTTENNPATVIRGLKPDLVVVGAVSGVAKPSGLEVGFGRAAMDAGIPVVLYRDFSGVNDEVVRPLADHLRSGELLRFFLFDEAAARTVRQRCYPACEVKVVGSSYYDDDATRNWEDGKKKAREALGMGDDEFVVVYLGGAERSRVLESLKPIVEGMREDGGRLTLLPFFHPKDPDAPYAPHPTEKGQWVARPSVYNEVLDQLSDSSVTVIREPDVRNLVTDPKLRIAVMDFGFMNPLSTDTWTAVYARKPFACPVLPLTLADGAKSGIEIPELDFIAYGAADAFQTEEGLRAYAARLTKERGEIAERLLLAQTRFTPREVARLIADELMRVIAEHS